MATALDSKLGDAAHPMLPPAGQGAAQALDRAKLCWTARRNARFIPTSVIAKSYVAFGTPSVPGETT
jgi:hypothetical protein